MAGPFPALTYLDITRQIIGATMHVHNTLAPGFKELIYQHALAIEMQYSSLSFEREKEMEIRYRYQLIGTRRAILPIR